MTCSHCDIPGGSKTYENQVAMPLQGRVRAIDHCIHHIVAALNAGGVETVACCCRHGTMPGVITLEDGRSLMIVDTVKDKHGVLIPDGFDVFCKHEG